MKITPTLRHRAAVLKAVFPDCYREVDGYWVWNPSDAHGCYSEWDLRVIAELLDEANRKWDAEILAWFETQRRHDSDA